MTSKPNTTKSALVPKLRFPKFRKTPGWKPSFLADACDMQAGKFVSASNISERNQDGMFPCYGGNGLRGYTTTHTHSGTYPLIGRQGALCGNVRLVSGQFHATEHAVTATPKGTLDVGWLHYSLDLLNLNRFATGQAQPGLSVDVLKSIPLAIPPQAPEQQRIAECLSSLDELMAAQARKVDALKTHKRGLMQQLFPREGETQPRLRFPEFQGDWALLRGSEITSRITKGSSPNWQGYNYQPQGVLFITSENVRDGFLDVSEPKFLPEEFFFKQSSSHLLHGDILINIVGASIGRSCVYRLRDPAFTNQAVALFRVTSEHSFEFVSYCYQHDRSQKAVSASQSDSARPNLSLSDLREMEFCMPSPAEQQRIADCLASLDAFIAAEAQKLDALKTHKKGLMQQLFPTPEQG